MKHLLRHRDSDALLDGDAFDEGSGLEDVAAFLSDMRVEFGAMPAPAPRPTLAATLDGRRELRPASAPAPKPTIPEPGPRVHYRFKPIAAMVASGIVLFGGLATAGALPGPAQRAVADATAHLGIDLPGRNTPQPASSGPDGKTDHHGGTATTPTSAHATVSGRSGSQQQPTSGSTTATTAPAAVSDDLDDPVDPDDGPRAGRADPADAPGPGPDARRPAGARAARVASGSDGADEQRRAVAPAPDSLGSRSRSGPRPRPPTRGTGHGGHVHAPRHDCRRHTVEHRLRGVPEDRWPVGAPAHVHAVRQGRLL